MHRIPRFRAYRQEIGAVIKRHDLIRALIIGGPAPKWPDKADPGVMILAVNHNGGMADRISEFIQYPAAEHGGRRQTQNQVLSIETGARHNCG